eukprot:gb/GEZN01006686.1/.p1 GENE.gb/GEZN01006686.1/~~gb/GEZN01006686.1/.p1  ORF type:complete len:525 (-),score=103.23 gb/GEZN01006686.1/:57-1532(-)
MLSYQSYALSGHASARKARKIAYALSAYDASSSSPSSSCCSKPAASATSSSSSSSPPPRSDKVSPSLPPDGTPVLRPITLSQVSGVRRAGTDPKALEIVAPILLAVKTEGEAALRRYAVKFGDIPSMESKLLYSKEDMKKAFDGLSPESQAVLQRTATRITAFAAAQSRSLKAFSISIEGGTAGLKYAPVSRAGCYAPGGRFPLPSSVLMTALTARAAGVREVWVASPRPSPETLAAGYVANADCMLAVGGAQAIGALAYGAGPVPPCDCIVGPGNMFVTAAKQLVAGEVSIDMLAGPSELLAVADANADPTRVAADLLAQAEHDPCALPILVCMDKKVLSLIEEQLRTQVMTLPTKNNAISALSNGYVVEVDSREEAAEACDRLAPEHLALHVQQPQAFGKTLHHYGALFVGEGAAEVLGDYGAGPNHVLPTGGTARSFGALSVMTFLRVQTSLDLQDMRAAKQQVQDSVSLARMEGLEAHARAAELRLV